VKFNELWSWRAGTLADLDVGGLDVDCTSGLPGDIRGQLSGGATELADDAASELARLLLFISKPFSLARTRGMMNARNSS